MECDKFNRGRDGKSNHMKRDLIESKESLLSDDELEEMQEFLDSAQLQKLKK
jgi:hypothetical protein